MTRAALWTKHRPIALAIASGFNLPGGDDDDIRQEALIALWVATGDWRSERGSFPNFARMVVRRRLDSVLKVALRQKHRPLDTSLRVVHLEEEGQVAISETLPDSRDTLDIVIDREALERVIAAVAALSEAERDALLLSVNGVPYAHDKRLDNAVSRARRKLRGGTS